MRSLSRKVGNRTALERNLLSSLVLHGKITTTESKAKHILPMLEKLLTRTKAADLAAKRYAGTVLTSNAAVSRLFGTVIPQLPKKTSGYVSITKTTARFGDAAGLAVVKIEQVKPEAEKPKTKPTKATAKPATKKKTV